MALVLGRAGVCDAAHAWEMMMHGAVMEEQEQMLTVA